MSIRFKLVLSYIAMLFIPIVLSLIAAVILSHVYMGDIKNIYSVDFKRNSIEQYIEQQASAYDDIGHTISNNPDRLLDVNYLQQIDNKMNSLNSGIIVRKNDQVVYVSSLVNKQEILNQLPQFGVKIQEPKPNFTGNSMFRFEQFDFYFRHFDVQFRQFDFYFSNNSRGSVYLITDFAPLGGFLRKFIHSQLLAVLLILILTNGLLTYIISRSIIKPIQKLKNASQQIKEGNLNFSISSKSNDEIGQLCQAFEEMRSRLKESIELQMQYEDNRKELMSNISHDLKTPVAAIKGYVAGIKDGVADTPEKLLKYIKTIDTKVSDVEKLIEELLLFSTLDLQKEPFNFEKVEIKQYLWDCTEELKFDLAKKERGHSSFSEMAPNIGIGLNLHLANKDPLWVVADREKLKRVINNIIDNAVKYLDKEVGTIDISLIEDSIKSVTLQITDNGQGIPKHALLQIFDRFYRVDPSRNSANGGSGLGLAIAKRIIEGHDEKIWAESQEGLGTRIFFTLKKVEDS